MTVLGLRCCAGYSLAAGFSLQWPRLWRTGSRACEPQELWCVGSAAAALEYRFSGCGAQA